MNLSKLSNLLMNIGIGFSVYGMYKIYDSKKGLPPGACPIEGNNHILYFAILLLVLSLVLSFVVDKREKTR